MTDGLTGFGRSILRGVMRYANLQRRWLIHEEMHRVTDPDASNWPPFDGAILAAVDAPVIEAAVKHCGLVVRCSGNADPNVSPAVCLDDYAAGGLAAEHLLANGIRHFGFVSHTVSGQTAKNRLAGFRTAIEAKGFVVHETGFSWITGTDRKLGAGHDHWPAMLGWIRKLPKPVGIFAVDDWAAHDLAAICVSADIPVPDHVAILGLNNDDLLCDSAWPPLSSVEADYSRVGYLAAGLLERMLAGETLSADERMIRVPPLGVIRRRSTEMTAVDDTFVADALHYIRDHACDPCNVSDVLRHVPVARRWLERRFVTLLGRTPHDEIMRVRIETAKRLLIQPELSIAEVAARCGSSAIQNFCRSFEQIVGQTPAVYKRSALRGKVTRS